MNVFAPQQHQRATGLYELGHERGVLYNKNCLNLTMLYNIL